MNMNRQDRQFHGRLGNALIATLIIVIAWVNYINLTACSMNRAKEVGIRKVPALRSQLIRQFRQNPADEPDRTEHRHPEDLLGSASFQSAGERDLSLSYYFHNLSQVSISS
jgi:hypothetical protein